MPSISFGVILLVLATGAVGCLFVFAGHRLLGVALAVIGGVLGAVVGAAIVQVLLPTTPIWAGAATGAVILAIMLALAGRLVAAGALAALLAAAGSLAVLSADRHGWIDFGAGGEPAQVGDAEAGAALPVQQGVTAALRHEVASRLDAVAAPLRAPTLAAHGGTIQDWFGAAWSSLHARWVSLAPAMRTLVLATGAMCGFLGLCLGLLAARWTAALVTALLGASLVLLAVASGARHVLGAGDALPGPPALWLAAWGALAMCGTAVQWRSAARPREAE